MDDRNKSREQLTSELEELRKRNEALDKAEDRRKQVEESLREKTQFIESLINLSPDILYIYDIVEQKNVFSNDGINKILGYSVEEIQEMGNQLISLLMHPDDFKKYRAEIYPQYLKVEDNKLINHHYRMKHKNGNWKWLDSNETIYMRQADGSPKQIFGVIHDI
ncbi:PAS domain-containing protein, partial [Candidatus Omnitrophota bacterium]